jgi:ribonuclease P protein component
VLARENRIVRGVDFRAVMRSGRRAGSSTAVVYVRRRNDDAPARFGFIVSKAVGDSVRRHLVTRRLRAIARETLPLTGVDIVVRALPASVEGGWASLHDEVRRGIEQGVST